MSIVEPFFKNNDDFFQKKVFFPFFNNGDAFLMNYGESSLYNITNIATLNPIDMNFIVTPRLDWMNSPIPFNALKHRRTEINGHLISLEVERVVNNYFSEAMMFSTHPDRYFAVRISKFSYDMLAALQSGYLTTPFILFDKNMDKCFCFDFDLEVNFFSAEIDKPEQRVCSMSSVEWKAYFDIIFDESVDLNEFHIKTVRSKFLSEFK